MTASTFSVFVAMFGGEGGGRGAGRVFSNHMRVYHPSSSSSCLWEAHGVTSSTVPPGRTFATGLRSAGTSSRDVPWDRWIKRITQALDFWGNIQALGAMAQRAADAAAR